MTQEDIVTIVRVQMMISKDPDLSFEILNAVVGGLKEYKSDVDKLASNIWLVVKNIKPEYLEEMKELIIPEVFKSLGL